MLYKNIYHYLNQAFCKQKLNYFRKCIICYSLSVNIGVIFFLFENYLMSFKKKSI